MPTVECQVAKPTTVGTLVDLLARRKTRRFGCGMELPGGPLKFRSEKPPQPLSAEELRYLLFAAVGETGPHLADMQYASRPTREDGQGMAIMNFGGRTVASACAAQTTKLFLSDDTGVYFVAAAPHPEGDQPPVLIPLQEGRLEIPRRLPYMLSFNQWYANRPGTTFFIPVTQIAHVYLNLLLVLLSEDYGYFFVDSDNGNASCGLDAFRRSRGGHLHDDLSTNRVLTLRDVDMAIADTALQEQGLVCQNLFLMTQAMGLGGGIQSVGSGRHLLGVDPGVYPGLGFRFAPTGIPGGRANPVGISGLWEGPCPPYVSSMKEAVHELVRSKFGAGGTYTNASNRPWVAPESRATITPHTQRTIDAVVSFCTYVYETYGRFPAHVDAFKTVTAFQSHHVDLAFYDKFYPGEAVSDVHRHHDATWHQCKETMQSELLAVGEGRSS